MKNKLKEPREKAFAYADGSKFRDKPIEEVFTNIFQRQFWDLNKGEESISGPGSSIEQTAEIRKEIARLLIDYKIKSIVDIPCGDFNWMKQLDLTGIKYTGADIVKELIRENNKQYSNEKISFVNLDLTNDQLPACDLIICRDCLVHFSFRDIQRAVENIINSGSKYLLTTTFVEQEANEDTVTGGWRPINLEKAPFNFPPPLHAIDENCTEMNGAFKDKSLSLFKICLLLPVYGPCPCRK
ncbi:MAG: class I SAM-dependent methyltransferase [bacterium]|nr:class I SAM-dependent methyltransferase [bacterium]